MNEISDTAGRSLTESGLNVPGAAPWGHGSRQDSGHHRLMQVGGLPLRISGLWCTSHPAQRWPGAGLRQLRWTPVDLAEDLWKEAGLVPRPQLLGNWAGWCCGTAHQSPETAYPSGPLQVPPNHSLWPRKEKKPSRNCLYVFCLFICLFWGQGVVCVCV